MERVLRLGIDPRAATEGARQYRAATEEVANASKRMAAAAEEAAVARQRSAAIDRAAASVLAQSARAQEQLDRRLADSRLQVAAGTVTETQALNFARQAKEAYNTTIVRLLETERAHLMVTREGRKAFVDTANSLTSTQQAAERAGVGLGQFNRGLLGVATRAAGMNPVVSQGLYLLGGFAFTGPQMAGAVAGLAGLALLYSKLTKGAGEFNDKLKEQADLIRLLGRSSGFGGNYETLQQVAMARSRQTLLRDDIAPDFARYQQIRGQLQGGISGSVLGTDLRTHLEAELRELWDKKLKAPLNEIAEIEAGIAVAMRRIELEAMQFADTMRNLNLRLGVDVGGVRIGGLVEDVERDVLAATSAYAIRRASGGGVVQNRIFGPAATVSGISPQVAGIFARQGMGIRSQYDPNNLLGGTVRGPSVEWLRATAGQSRPGVAAGTDWGRWGQAAQIGGGLLLGTGLAGDGYAAAGLSGGLGMAAQGASVAQSLSATAGPIGAVVGAVGGLVTGLLGHAERAREAAQLLREATRQLELNIEARRAAAAGDTAEAERFRLLAQHEKELSEARKSGMSTSTIAALGLVQAEEKMALARDQATRAAQEEAQAQEKLADAMRRATEEAISAEQLQNERAAALSEIIGSFTLRQRRMTEGPDTPFYMTADYLEMFRRQADEKQRLTELGAGSEAHDLARIVHGMEEAALFAERQTHLVEEQLRVNQDQLRAQEQTVATLRQVHDGLADYGRSLLVGPQSPLSPYSQLVEARNQFEAMRALAAGGDVSAAQSLAGSGRTLLDASRGYNASGPGYVADFRRVQEGVEQVRARFGAQASVEEQILAQIQAQTQSLEAQAAGAREQWAIERANWAEQLRRMQEQIDALDDIGDEIGSLSAPSTGTDGSYGPNLNDPEAMRRFWEEWERIQREHLERLGGGGDVNPPVSEAVVAELQSGFTQLSQDLGEIRDEQQRLREHIGALVPA